MKKLFLVLISFLFIAVVYGQKVKKKHEKVYKMNYWVDVPVTVGLLAGYHLGMQTVMDRANPTPDEINVLNQSDVWFFDRRAFYQDASQMDNARNISDWGLKIATVMPVLLLIDREIRRDWYDIALLYFETQSVALNAYLFGGPFLIKRYRPFAYYEELSMDSKTGDGTVNSWFSGHTSTTSTASFFMAKVYTDYHPELGAKKWIFFGAALLPPAFVGIYRIKALKHFPTDVIMGTAVGAAAGILIPHFHKIIKNKDLSVVPFAGKHSGLAMSYRF